MSGGFFEYQQYRIEEIAESIKECIRRPEDYSLTKEVVDEMKTAVKYLEYSYVYVSEFDRLVSNDSSTESFFEKLNSDLQILNKKYERSEC